MLLLYQSREDVSPFGNFLRRPKGNDLNTLLLAKRSLILKIILHRYERPKQLNDTRHFVYWKTSRRKGSSFLSHFFISNVFYSYFHHYLHSVVYVRVTCRKFSLTSFHSGIGQADASIERGICFWCILMLIVLDHFWIKFTRNALNTHGGLFGCQVDWIIATNSAKEGAFLEAGWLR